MRLFTMRLVCHLSQHPLGFVMGEQDPVLRKRRRRERASQSVVPERGGYRSWLYGVSALRALENLDEASRSSLAHRASMLVSLEVRRSGCEGALHRHALDEQLPASFAPGQILCGGAGAQGAFSGFTPRISMCPSWTFTLTAL